MDPSEPERKSPTEEAVDAHDHVHVEIPDGKRLHSQIDKEKCCHLTWLNPKPLQSRTITTPATWVLSSCTTSSNRVKTPVKKSKRGTWEKKSKRGPGENTQIEKMLIADADRGPPVVATGQV